VGRHSYRLSDLDKGKEKNFEKIISNYLSTSPEEQEIFAIRETQTQDPIDKIPELKNRS
jgi:hypothetical protein